ncbi:hypothetical protein L207DRAFT_532487 [Hyaloscypha variabilis F]|uniref:Uncharacterized protein n=1 Tax=Hyaloscypha variabilis (strain UAMH 11265 / GT02V1 / F) TaxID=1149755 RepID=A0A2J6REI6_HYAVF|nr:hypothetical protein L207DRAFT_532487 [Hyaloscypha variabilis F]
MPPTVALLWARSVSGGIPCPRPQRALGNIGPIPLASRNGLLACTHPPSPRFAPWLGKQNLQKAHALCGPRKAEIQRKALAHLSVRKGIKPRAIADYACAMAGLLAIEENCIPSTPDARSQSPLQTGVWKIGQWSAQRSQKWEDERSRHGDFEVDIGCEARSPAMISLHENRTIEMRRFSTIDCIRDMM